MPNGDASEATVLVESDFRAGSFIISLQFEQHVIETAAHLITHHQFLTAGSLAALIGFIKKGSEWGESLIDLWKWLRGKKPDKATQTGSNTEVTLGANKKTVSNVVYNLYGDSAIRAAFGQATEPLRRKGSIVQSSYRTSLSKWQWKSKRLSTSSRRHGN